MGQWVATGQTHLWCSAPPAPDDPAAEGAIKALVVVTRSVVAGQALFGASYTAPFW